MEVFKAALTAHRDGRLDEAEALYRTLLHTDYAPVFANLGVALRITGRLDEAESMLRRAVVIDPEKSGPRHSLGMTLIQAGRYAEGWRLYEARHEFLPRPRPHDSIPEWRGESLKGRRVLVIVEQGFGDQILLSRFLPLLAQEAGNVAFLCARPTLPLFAQMPYGAFNVGSFDELEADVWLSLGSVAAYLGAGPDDAPAPTILTPKPLHSRGGLGLMLGGKESNANNRYRLPPPNAASAIRAVADFVDLDPKASGAKNFQQTAEIIAGLDGVVTVDTSVAHLAGAMGKPCLILAPRPAIDWYTSWSNDRTPWYPSARIIRQRAPGDWMGVVADLKREIGSISVGGAIKSGSSQEHYIA